SVPVAEAQQEHSNRALGDSQPADPRHLAATDPHFNTLLAKPEPGGIPPPTRVAPGLHSPRWWVMFLRDAHQVLVVDDQTILRAGVRTVLERTGEYHVLAEASSLGEAEVRLGTLPDTTRILVSDIQLRREWAFDLIRAARRRERPLDVVVLTECLTGWNLRCALQAGARGFLPKDT